MEKHVTYKFPWDMDRVGKEYEKKAKNWFKYMETERYKTTLNLLWYLSDWTEPNGKHEDC
jgi:hypothetical protein